MGKILDYLLNECNCKLVSDELDGMLEDDHYQVVRTIDGDYVTGSFLAENPGNIGDLIYSHKLTQIQALNRGSGNAVSLGFSEDEQAWYGWTHRGYGSFSIGKQLPKDAAVYGSSLYPIEPGKAPETLEECKYFAMAMADVLD